MVLVIGYSLYERQRPQMMQEMQMAGITQTKPAAHYENGTYTGPVTDAFYGKVQVQVVIKNHRIAHVTFLKQPDSTAYTRMVNAKATPILKREAVKKQSAHVDVVSSASQTSAAFVQSLSSALMKAS